MAEHEQSPDIFKLNIDCFDETFDVLPQTSLITVGQTCKRLSQVAGNNFYENYPDARVSCRSVEAKYFPQFIRNVIIKSEDDFQHFVNVQSDFHRLERINLENIKLELTKIQSIKGILCKVKDFGLTHFNVNSTVLETIDSCANIKHLCIFYTNIEGNNDWLLRKYPTLECFEFHVIASFLELNPNILKFMTCANILMTNEESFENANFNLNDIMVVLEDIDYFESPALFRFMNELYKRGLYKRLYLYYREHFDQNVVDQLISLDGLVKIRAYNYGYDYIASLSALRSLKEFSFYSNSIVDFFFCRIA